MINVLDLESEEFGGQGNAVLFGSQEEREIHQVSSDEVMLPILEFIDENVIGGKTKFQGPYGQRRGKTDIKIAMTGIFRKFGSNCPEICDRQLNCAQHNL